MLETYQNGGDIHALTTAVIYRIPLEEASGKNHPQYKERRTIAKNCNFGTFFGLFPKGLQKTLKFKAGLTVSLEECETIILHLKIGYPRLERWREEVKRSVPASTNTQKLGLADGTISSILHLPTGRKILCRACCHEYTYPRYSRRYIEALYGKNPKKPDRPWLMPILKIHDKLVFEIPEKQLDKVKHFPIEPSLVVRIKRGFHCYWLMKSD